MAIMSPSVLNTYTHIHVSKLIDISGKIHKQLIMAGISKYYFGNICIYYHSKILKITQLSENIQVMVFSIIVAINFFCLRIYTSVGIYLY